MPDTVLRFWFEELQPAQWWRVDPALDASMRARLSAMRGYMPGENFDSVAYDFIYGPQQ